MKDPRNEKEPESFFCKCKDCKGDSVGYDFNDMLDPFGDCISRWCASLKELEYYENAGPPISRTNAEYELRTIGAREFFKKYFNVPLEPFIKPKQLDELFDRK
jgi:hypothetical protein